MDLLNDLARGHVRRRALFSWTFVLRSIPPANRPFAGLVKFDRSGGGQIPETEEGFQIYPADPGEPR